MKPVRLYNFSIPSALSALVVFPFLIYVCVSRALFESLYLWLVPAVLLLGCFIYIIYKSLAGAAVLDDAGASHKGLRIPKARIEVVSEYDTRFKEAVYLLRDSAADYTSPDDISIAARQIRVQATASNTAKLTEYLRRPVTPAPKPRHRWKK